MAYTSIDAVMEAQRDLGGCGALAASGGLREGAKRGGLKRPLHTIRV
jgi:hypothetical protein